MQSTLMVNGVDCKTKVIDGMWYVVVDDVPQKLYREKTKYKGKKNGTYYVYKLKGICQVCMEEFFGFLKTKRLYCSKKCSNKINGKLAHNKFIELSSDKKLKTKARNFINHNIKRGKIIRPEVCSNCHCHGSIQFHHPNYNKINEGMWLCCSCHRKLDYGDKNINGKLMIYSLTT